MKTKTIIKNISTYNRMSFKNHKKYYFFPNNFAKPAGSKNLKKENKVINERCHLLLSNKVINMKTKHTRDSGLVC